MRWGSAVPGAPRAGGRIATTGSESAWGQRLADFRARHAPRAETVAGREWTYLQGGAGAHPLLLLHGSHSDGESLFGLMAGLERISRVIAPTYPDDLDRIVDIADGLAGLLDKLEIASALVVGYSLGSYLAQALAWRHPARVTGLALLHSGAPDPLAARLAAVEGALLALAPPGLIDSGALVGVSALLARGAPGLAPADAAFWRRYLTGMVRRVGKRRMCVHARLVVDFLGACAVQPGAPAAAKPTLLVHGGRDRTIEPSERRALDASYSQATQVTLPDAGHLSVMTAPEPYIAIIGDVFEPAQSIETATTERV